VRANDSADDVTRAGGIPGIRHPESHVAADISNLIRTCSLSSSSSLLAVLCLITDLDHALPLLALGDIIGQLDLLHTQTRQEQKERYDDLANEDSSDAGLVRADS
jgi:hypothetical protein